MIDSFEVCFKSDIGAFLDLIPELATFNSKKCGN